MQRKSAFKAELYKGLNIMRLLNRLSLKAYAEETDPANEPEDKGGEGNNPQLTFNFEAMIAQARKEEKDKLYPRLKKAEDEVKVLTSSVNKYLLENAALKEELEKMKSSKGDSKEITELKSKIEALEAENKALKESISNEDEIRNKIKAEYEIKLYAKEQLEANKGEILSIFASEIVGDTKEAIDQAIIAAKEKTLSIKKDLGLVDEDGKEITTPKKKSPADKKKAPPAAPADGGDEETFDAEYIRNLDPRSPEYAEFRKKMGLK